jgi:Protein of unknown function (DUF3122)
MVKDGIRLCLILLIRRIRLGVLLLILLVSYLTLTQPAWAVLRQHQDEPGVMRYHSQESLRDDSGKVLQVILFKQISPGKPIIFNLRLVGFPGIVEFTHPQNLEITTELGQILTAADVYPQGAPAPNVGQYDFTKILTQLAANQSLELAVQLAGENAIQLKIPQSLATEWHLLASEL